MRILYLDDSGKSHPNHPSRSVAYAGFSIEDTSWHAFVRQVAGAKALHFPRRGRPTDWEIKSTDLLTPNAWNRANNRRFCFEVVDILRRNECTVYSVYLSKANASRALADDWVVPKCFQVLAAKFCCELEVAGTTGTITCDWSTHANDRHVCRCVTSFGIARNLWRLIGGVTYGSSRALIPIQVCDLIAASFRMGSEGQAHLERPGRNLVAALRALVGEPQAIRDAEGHSPRTEVCLF